MPPRPDDRESPDSELAGLVALVSGGGGRGLGTQSVGEAICLGLARRGAQVVVANRNARVAQGTAARIAAEGGIAAAAIGDVSDEVECARMVSEAVCRFGAIDILVSNVARVAGSPVPASDGQTWDRTFAVNVTSLLFLAKYALPAMPPGGAIVAISSVAVTKPAASAAYCASKGALEALTMQMALDQGPRGIRCNIVRVGEIWSAMTERSCANDEEKRLRLDFYRRRNLLAAAGTPTDVAAAACFLAGPRSRWITGQTITVDGGAELIRSNPDWEDERRTWSSPVALAGLEEKPS